MEKVSDFFLEFFFLPIGFAGKDFLNLVREALRLSCIIRLPSFTEELENRYIFPSLQEGV
jgi:hypothetical protein